MSVAKTKKSSSKPGTRTIRTEVLSRVEGEGGLYVKIANGEVADVQLKIFEPPRFFEAFLRGRSYEEAPDITARICGICPVAYQMCAVQSMEAAFGATVTPEIRALRRLLYCGEWIESHTLHIVFLHAPDFLGYPDGIAMARDHRELVLQALHIKKSGNELMTVVGGREIHPINVRVGGFYRAPAASEFTEVRAKLETAREYAAKAVRFAAGLPFPDFERDYEFVALRHPEEYPITEGRLVSSGGLDIDVADYERHFVEEHVRHSNALHSILRGRGPYHVGPLARFNLNYDRLPGALQEMAASAGLQPGCRNPFKSILVRAIELLFACEEAIRLIDEYRRPDPPAVPVEPREASGCAITEAPRGILYHRYQLDESGAILEAKIVPPTSQNQKTIEADLRELVGRNLEMQAVELTPLCEQAVRNYDPCISCATHFLKFELERN
jgi:coenzyme F420-reducing hydrogenase alpha subunit